MQSPKRLCHGWAIAQSVRLALMHAPPDAPSLGVELEARLGDQVVSEGQQIEALQASQAELLDHLNHLLKGGCWHHHLYWW